MKIVKKDLLLSLVFFIFTIIEYLNYGITYSFLIGVLLTIANLFFSYLIENLFNGYILKHKRRALRNLKKNNGEKKIINKILIFIIE